MANPKSRQKGSKICPRAPPRASSRSTNSRRSTSATPPSAKRLPVVLAAKSSPTAHGFACRAWSISNKRTRWTSKFHAMRTVACRMSSRLSKSNGTSSRDKLLGGTNFSSTSNSRSKSKRKISMKPGRCHRKSTLKSGAKKRPTQCSRWRTTVR